jgi:DnaJ-class molecular chaperone
MDDWEDPDERLKAEVIRDLGPDASGAHVEVTSNDSFRTISISGLGPLHGPTCKKCGGNLITAGMRRKHWWQRSVQRVCPTCDPDHPLSIFIRNSAHDFE